jgi:hypothetical protein
MSVCQTASPPAAWSTAAVERWARDPGALRLTQGLKTVLAVLLVLVVLRPFVPFYQMLPGALGTGFLMQCGEGTTRRQRQLTMVVSGLVMILLAVVGGMLEGYEEIKEILIVVVAFLTFYVRRYVPGKPGFTSYGFVTFLLASILPGGLERAAMNAVLLVVALVVAFTVFFLIRPPDVLGAFAQTVRARCAAQAVLLHQPSVAATNLSSRIQRVIVRLGALAQALLDAAPPGPIRERAEELQREQIDIRQMVQMLLNALVQIEADPDRPAEVMPLLKPVLEAYAVDFGAVAEGKLGTVDPAPPVAGLEQWARQPDTPLGPTLTQVGTVLHVAHRLKEGLRRMAEDLEGLTGEQSS